MRADLYLVTHGFAGSREKAKKLILGGCVTLDGARLSRPAEEIGDGEHTLTVRDPARFVSRGGEKLEAALTAFGLNPLGWRALDIGASTGGFTDCLLQNGAASVTAVASGAGQMSPHLAADPRVTCFEHCNARYLTPEAIGGRVRLIVMDVSFISGTLILPRFSELAEPVADAVCLIKPQFEVGRAYIGKGGIVRDPAAHRMAVERVIHSAESLGMRAVGLIPSPIDGGDGNREFLVHLPLGQDLPPADASRVAEVTRKRENGGADAENRTDYEL